MMRLCESTTFYAAFHPLPCILITQPRPLPRRQCFQSQPQLGSCIWVYSGAVSRFPSWVETNLYRPCSNDLYRATAESLDLTMYEGASCIVFMGQSRFGIEVAVIGLETKEDSLVVGSKQHALCSSGKDIGI